MPILDTLPLGLLEISLRRPLPFFFSNKIVIQNTEQDLELMTWIYFVGTGRTDGMGVFLSAFRSASKGRHENR